MSTATPARRRFINALFWVLRTGAPWRNLPSDYGNGSAHNDPPR